MDEGKHKPEVSHSIKEPSSPAAKWLESNHRFLRLMGTILAVVHPEQYKTGLAILTRIQDDPNLLRQPEYVDNMSTIWCCPFSGISVLCNACTPEHRDPLGQNNWYDILATMGTYSRQHQFYLPGLGTSVSYGPGTVVAICGWLLSHAVDFAAEGDQAVFAGYNRESVRKWLNLPEGEYSTVDNIIM